MSGIGENRTNCVHGYQVEDCEVCKPESSFAAPPGSPARYGLWLNHKNWYCEEGRRWAEDLEMAEWMVETFKRHGYRKSIQICKVPAPENSDYPTGNG